jgi:ribulose 1,5-bisphosphate carboxylase large subunit-like protein
VNITKLNTDHSTDATDILASFEVKGAELSTSDATRIISNAANGNNIERFYPSMTNKSSPIARPVCAHYVEADTVEVTLAIPHHCFDEGSLTRLLNTLHTALDGTDSKLVDLHIPKNILKHFGASNKDVKTLCTQLKAYDKPLFTGQDPWQKSAFIFDVIKGGKGTLDAKVTKVQA